MIQQSDEPEILYEHQTLIDEIDKLQPELDSFIARQEVRAQRIKTIIVVCSIVASICGGGVVKDLYDTYQSNHGKDIIWFGLAILGLLASVAVTGATQWDQANKININLIEALEGNADLVNLRTLCKTSNYGKADATQRLALLINKLDFLRTSKFGSDTDTSKIKGAIHSPQSNQTVGRTFSCHGTVKEFSGQVSLWVFVEIDGKFWPKEQQPRPDAKGRWSVVIFQDGNEEQFHLSLFAVAKPKHKEILKWFDECSDSGSYPPMVRPLTATRLVRVENLRIQMDSEINQPREE